MDGEVKVVINYDRIARFLGDTMMKSEKSLACVINSSERSDFLRFYVYLCQMLDILYLSFKQH